MTDESSWQVVSDRYKDAMSGYVEDIARLDLAIKKHTMFLRSIQPYAPGKIDVKFLPLRGGDDPEPVFVSWKKNRDGDLKLYTKLRTEQIVRHIKRYGPFSGTHQDVRFLVENIRTLMERRRTAVRILGDFMRSASQSQRAIQRDTQKLVSVFEAEMLNINARHMARLADWRSDKDKKAQEAVERESRYAIADPDEEDPLYAEKPKKPGLDPSRYAIPEPLEDEEEGTA